MLEVINVNIGLALLGVALVHVLFHLRRLLLRADRLYAMVEDLHKDLNRRQS